MHTDCLTVSHKTLARLFGVRDGNPCLEEFSCTAYVFGGLTWFQKKCMNDPSDLDTFMGILIELFLRGPVWDVEIL